MIGRAARRRRPLMAGPGIPRSLTRSTAPRSRRGLLVTGMIVVIAGLLAHFLLVGPAADFLADALYAVLVYVVLCFAAPRFPGLPLAVVAWGICALIELSQLTGVPAALAEAFPPVRLVLGTTFVAVDLVAYAVGVVAAFVTVDSLPRARDAARR
jgi:hypothetical protein